MDNMQEATDRLMLALAPMDVKRHVLWFFGDQEYGQEPGSFTQTILQAVAIADPDNRKRLSEGFGLLVTVFLIGREHLEMVRESVQEEERIRSEFFDMPSPVVIQKGELL